MKTIIVGAGLAGTSVAYHLAGRRQVHILEQGDTPGAEASAQNAGMVRRLGEDPWERALAIRTVERLVALDSNPGPFQISPSRVVGAVLALAHDEGHLNDAVAHCRLRGIQVEVLKDAASVSPVLAGSALRRAWYLPQERVADAHQLVWGMLRGARDKGATLSTQTPVLSLLIEGGRCVGVQTLNGPEYADEVVLAAGAWSGTLAASAGLHRPLIPIRRTLVQTTAHPQSAPHLPWTWIDDVGLYARPEGEGWMLSGCDETIDPPPLGPGSRGPVENEPRALLLHKIEHHMPVLSNVRVHTGWTGLRTFAPDRRPLLGADPELPGLWWAAGLGGFGVTCSLAIGECVAAWMNDQTVPWIKARPVSPGRPQLRRWPIRPDGTLSGAVLVDGQKP